MSFLLSFFLSHKLVWSNRAKSDLAQMRRTLLTSSAGTIDSQHHFYYPWLKLGFKNAQSLAKRVSSYQGYAFALRYYAAGFHDEHISVEFPTAAADTVKRNWPGFFLHYNNNQLLVSGYRYPLHHAKLPQREAQLISCNGKSAKELMLSRVFAYYGNPKLQADWVHYAPNLLVDQGNPFVSKLTQCVFKYHHHRFLYRLHWRVLPIKVKLSSVSWSYQPSFGVSTFARNRGVWVNIMTFSPKVKGAITHLKKLVRLSPGWRDKKYIVLDVRGNGGGNSGWGELILKGIYGAQYFEWAQGQAHVHISQFWRVSKANYHYFITSILPSIARQYGKSSFDYQVFLESANQMKQKLDHNQQGFVPQRQELSHYSASVQKPQPLTHAKVLIVTDGRCGSSCLSFLDQAVNMPGVTLVGKESHAESIYSEFRLTMLHSGYAEFGIPMKVTYHRKRSNNQPYKPNIPYIGDINNTRLLKQWLVKEVLKDH